MVPGRKPGVIFFTGTDKIFYQSRHSGLIFSSWHFTAIHVWISLPMLECLCSTQLLFVNDHSEGNGNLVQLFETPWTRARQALLSSTASRSLVKFMLVASMTLSNHLVLCCPLLLLPSLFPNIRVFSRESSLLTRWPKYWSLSFRSCSSSEHSGLISFRMDRFVLFAVQGTLKSLLQHHNSKTSILQQSAFFMAQLSFPYIATFVYVDLCWQGDISAF